MRGRPHVLGEVLATADACLAVFYPGPALGTAVADVLLGRREPRGRLPVSLPRAAASLPVHYNHRDHDWAGDVDAPPGSCGVSSASRSPRTAAPWWNCRSVPNN
ncbi:Glycosyl hydrolase family 3 C-terminal domain-containing protein [Goodfellowiella coeruleoviolacea]|uniref:Glycosyl hydrolase family 3 C-terminal domain-containing protein n=1 Tax=Goodfellowiella coeruleoviolacea TaxID=334858 RepID=A0AAE3KIE6_9PSEU|nr:Glycosyl hydrolase family 3 C-terminal domain-containing protein [Goodfellowiella coeruleoviolacea]